MRRRYSDVVPPTRTDRRPPWRASRGDLVAGEVSARAVYRWLRRQRRDCGDVYLTVRWDPEDGELPDPAWHVARELPDPVWAALWAFELPCKLLDARRSSLEVRTRAWRGSEDRVSPRRHAACGWGRGARGYGWPTDRSAGLRYARLLARLLRAAHRARVRLSVEAA